MTDEELAAEGDRWQNRMRMRWELWRLKNLPHRITPYAIPYAWLHKNDRHGRAIWTWRLLHESPT